MLSIIIPAHNEEKRIKETLEEYSEFFSKKKIDFEILIVLNACKDKTLDVVKNAEKKYKEIRHIEFKEAGKGFAIIEGFKDSIRKNRDLIGFVDADMATPPESFFDLYAKIDEVDGVIASRWIKGSRIAIKQSLLRKLMSSGFNFLVRSILFMPYRDTQCGAKLFRKKALESVVDEVGITRWAFDIDLLFRLRKKGFRIIEIPTVWNDRKGSKLNLKKVPFQMFSAIIRLRLIYSPFNFIVRLYNKLPEKMKIHSF